MRENLRRVGTGDKLKITYLVERVPIYEEENDILLPLALGVGTSRDVFNASPSLSKGESIP